MNIITVDFETYYDKTYSLSKITTEEYIRSPLFEVIGVAVKVGGGETQWFSGDKAETKKFLKQFDWEHSLLLAQNTAFDAAILSWVFGINPVGYLDTMSMANAMHGLSISSSLASLAEHYGEVEKGGQVATYLGYHRTDFSPEQLEDYANYCIHDVELCYNIFNKMIPNFPKSEFAVIDLTIRMFAQPKLILDEKMLVEDLMNVRAAKRGALLGLMKMLGVKNEDDLKKQLMSNDKFAELLKSRGIDPPTKVSEKTGKEAWAFAKTDEEFTNLAEADDPIVSTLISTRLDAKSTIIETRTEAFADIAARGTYPFSLKYSGAGVTHRWSGFDLNPQNLPRGSMLRKAIMAPPGYVLVVADSSNIELRTGMWLAGQEDMLNLIREGKDLYRDFSSEAFNLKYDDIAKDSVERFVGKVCHLSLLYQTGAEKLRNTIRIQSKGKTTITSAEAERLKNLYREKHQMIVESWHEGGRILDWIYYNESHTAYDLVPVLGRSGIIKPNGLSLVYPNLRKVQTAKGEEYRYDVRRGRATLEDKAYPGKCMQRINQSLARDIMAEQTTKINKRYWVAGLVHDEVICVVPEGEAQEAKAFIETTMRTPPKWAPDLPLNCEVGIGKRYGEAK